MKFFGPVQSKQTNKNKQINVHLLITGFFVIISYILNLLPLALFAIAQTMAIFGRKYSTLLAVGTLLLLIIAALVTGFAPIVLAAFFALIATPLYLIVSILRQKQTSILWSAAVLLTPVLLFFSAVIFAPKLDSVHFQQEIENVEKIMAQAQSKKQTDSTQSELVYEKFATQIDALKKDNQLQQFMNYNPAQRLLYFVYGNGFSIFLIILLTFFASLFFLDFAFEQVEKLFAIHQYIKSKSNYSFDPIFLMLLKDITSRKDVSKNIHLDKNFKINKHIKLTPDDTGKRVFGLLRKPNPENTVSFREYLFYYSGKQPGWGLRTYQMPLALCLSSIVILSAVVFYYGTVPNIITALGNDGLVPFLLLISSVISMCVLSFLVLQGIFTALKWIPFGVLIVLSIIFLLVSPYILVDLGPFMFLGLFGVVGLLGYLK